jgi:hypothetical protein
MLRSKDMLSVILLGLAHGSIGLPSSLSQAYAGPDAIREVPHANFSEEGLLRYRDQKPVLFTATNIQTQLQHLQQTFSVSNLKASYGDAKVSVGKGHELVANSGYSKGKISLRSFLADAVRQPEVYLFDRGQFLGEHKELTDLLNEVLPPAFKQQVMSGQVWKCGQCNTVFQIHTTLALL